MTQIQELLNGIFTSWNRARIILSPTLQVMTTMLREVRHAMAEVVVFI